MSVFCIVSSWVILVPNWRFYTRVATVGVGASKKPNGPTSRLTRADPEVCCQFLFQQPLAVVWKSAYKFRTEGGLQTGKPEEILSNQSKHLSYKSDPPCCYLLPLHPKLQVSLSQMLRPLRVPNYHILNRFISLWVYRPWFSYFKSCSFSIITH